MEQIVSDLIGLAIEQSHLIASHEGIPATCLLKRQYFTDLMNYVNEVSPMVESTVGIVANYKSYIWYSSTLLLIPFDFDDKQSAMLVRRFRKGDA